MSALSASLPLMGADDQPRDDHGMWTKGGGRDARSWAAKFAGPLANKAEKDGGFTYRPGAPKNARIPTDGIMVSRAPSEGQGHVVEIAKMAEAAASRENPPTAAALRAEVVTKTRDAVKAWLAKAVPNIQKLGPDHYLGGWFEKDDKGNPVALHLDVSQRFDPKDREKALSAGRARNQLAVWDIGKMEEIKTGGTGR